MYEWKPFKAILSYKVPVYYYHCLKCLWNCSCCVMIYVRTTNLYVLKSLMLRIDIKLYKQTRYTFYIQLLVFPANENALCNSSAFSCKDFSMLTMYSQTSPNEQVASPYSWNSTTHALWSTLAHLHGCDGSLFGGGDSLLHGTHVSGQGGLVTHSRGDTTQQGGHLHTQYSSVVYQCMSAQGTVERTWIQPVVHLHLFRLQPLYMEWPVPSSVKKTLSGLLQI